ncbi:unnamed protein product [Camellia sinensis]
MFTILSSSSFLPVKSQKIKKLETENTMKKSMEGFTKLFFFLYSLFSIITTSKALDTITKTQFITYNNTIVSPSESFEMGFFTPGNSKNWYIAIWYKKIASGTIVWVANRDNPLPNSSGVLKLIDPGILALLNSTNNTVWSTNTSRSTRNPVARLLDSGNLIIQDPNDHNPENFLWQSFDYPCDTLLPGMKIGKNLVTGREWHMSSWKSKDDPAHGDYTYWLDLRGYPQTFFSEGSVVLYRPGPWNGLRFTGTATILIKNPIFKFGMHFEKDEIYFSYDLLNSSVPSIFIVTPNGFLQRRTWINQNKGWVLYANAPTTVNCNSYNLCGAYGSCDVDKSPVCGCLSKFVPKNLKDWNLTNWSGGCVRRTVLDCKNGDGFLKYSGVKLPDTQSSWYNWTMTLGECREVCLKNCSCMAYSSLDIRGGGSGCLLWFDDLVDIRLFNEGGGQDIYIRMASSELDGTVQQAGFNGKRREIVIVTLTLLTGMLLLGLIIMLYIRKNKKKKKDSQLKIEGRPVHNSKQGSTEKNQKEDMELPLFDFATIASSTNNFSIDNKLGEGGYGPVYKGSLEGGQEIAIKRLSKYSNQGLDEFKNEVICIAKLQHRNLVKLLGCCIQREEKMLIYEFMPNKSLDLLIFDEGGRTLMGWPKRFHIINGIARALLYLHQDSRLRIIHRDLKASNILLDIDMNPKISDFGMARIFGGNETEGNTSRVVGTYGYMSPEYAVDGLFSIKSDVFSFGVIVLEIVSGKRNRGIIHLDHHFNLLGHAWGLYEEGKSMELVDGFVRDSCCLSEVLRSIHVGLLCVQQHPEDRPTMSSVVMMLGSKGELPWPKQPGFFTESTGSSSKYAPCSANELTITTMQPR